MTDLASGPMGSSNSAMNPIPISMRPDLANLKDGPDGPNGKVSFFSLISFSHPNNYKSLAETRQNPYLIKSLTRWFF
jgi:hypothetical protein